MNSFALLADPVRRRILEILSDGEQSAGMIGEAVSAEFHIRQPAVSNQLRVLREADVVQVEPSGSHRIYRLRPGGLDEVAAWVDRYSRLWPQRLDALETELARENRALPEET
ncbi:ArsR/SmtB family transcription factor [Brachybacterium sp. J153]|uniref:ArsR/SmtB family transcription factor n=1 Tax=Brachybacterium sp. J153 TaxID=3116488 RepID=UPI002E79CFEB|nr:metalloregulator ArsR/SmtB family transcription factor [Brachybacterium sp. J153]MEE1619348.1 metalloregulator ArsR/SmtB family transcription factor [Brachybacterium sp. J153]